jgi:hypothetical protein
VARMSMYFFTKARPPFQGPWVLLAGFCSGAAALFKPVGLSPLLAQMSFVFLLWAVGRGVPGQRLLAIGLANSAAALTAWFPFAIYFRRHNALGEFVEASLNYNLYYVRPCENCIRFWHAHGFKKLRCIKSLTQLLANPDAC